MRYTHHQVLNFLRTRHLLFLFLIALTCGVCDEIELAPKYKRAGQLAEIDFNRQASHVFSQLPRQFPETSKTGFWEFRAKTRSSIGTKIRRFVESGKAKDIAEARQLIFDGIGARLALDQPTAEVMNTFTRELAELLKQGKLRVITIENYHAGVAVPYLSPENIQLLRSASPTHFNVLSGDKAVKEDGYTSLHLDLEYVGGPRFELQVRGVFIQQFSSISHLFYGFRAGKPIDRLYRKNPQIEALYKEFGTLNERQLSDYDTYLAEGFKFVHSYVSGAQYERAPQLPESLEDHPQLSVEQIAHTLTLYRLRNLYEDPGDFAERRKFLYFDSLRHLLTSQSEEVIDSIIGNVVQAGKRRERAIDIKEERRKLLESMDGLNFVDVIVWKESPFYKYRRRRIRNGEEWPEKVELPEYDRNQELGVREVDIKDIYYMQDSADNETGPYTVIGNAQAIQQEKLDMNNSFEPIQVWRDRTGKVWSLDHRRLAAMELSGVVGKVKVEFVSEEAVEKDRFKFTTASDGRSIIITIEGGAMAYVISKETGKKYRPAEVAEVATAVAEGVE